MPTTIYFSDSQRRERAEFALRSAAVLSGYGEHRKCKIGRRSSWIPENGAVLVSTGIGRLVVHVELNALVKLIQNSNCKRRTFRTRGLNPVSLTTVGLWVGQGQRKLSRL